MLTRLSIVVVVLSSAIALAQQPRKQDTKSQPPARPADPSQVQAPQRPRDPAAEAMTVRDVPVDRPEQRLTEHDRSKAFDPKNPAPITNALKDQAKSGRILGFDFARDPLGAD